MRLLDLFERQPPTGDGFRQWFGDSKVVDNSGHPMVVYHGTKDNFELEKMWPWSHFGTSEAANTRASSSVFNISGQSAQVFPAYLSLQNPLRIKDNGLETPGEYAKAILRSGAFSRRERNTILKNWDSMDLDEKFETLEQAVRSKGYDGLVYTNKVEDSGSISYVVFEPRQQVRSAFDQSLTESVGWPRLYHGSEKQWTQYDPRYGRGDSFIYTTRSPEVARSYGDYVYLVEPTVPPQIIDITRDDPRVRKELQVFLSEYPQYRWSVDELRQIILEGRMFVRDEFGHLQRDILHFMFDSGYNCVVIADVVYGDVHANDNRSYVFDNHFDLNFTLLSDLNEATRPFVQKAIDPALMTFSEYRELVDPDQKSHPPDAYDSDLEDLNSYQGPEDYETLLNTIKRHGLEFEVRRNTRDMWDGRYVKTTPDGDLVRDEQGKATYLDQEEVAMMFPGEKRYRYEYGIIDKSSGQIVANTQDEWGALLARTAREYRKFGFGTLLVKLAREDRPDRSSGGLTRSGYANLGRVHDEMVREYLSSGFYSHLVKTGQITAGRAKEIIAGVQPKKQPQQRNLNTADPKDWLLMTNSQSFVILYDKKLYELEDLDDDDIQHWIDRHIIGMASLASMGGDSSAWVNRTYGPDRIKGFLLAALLQMEPGEPIRMEPDEAQLAANHLGDKLKEVPKQRPGDFDQYYVENRDKTWRYMGNQEQQYRKHRDPYGEWYARIIEWAESLGN